MNNTLRTILIVVGVALVSMLLFFAGIAFESNRWGTARSWMGSEMGGGMMSGFEGYDKAYPNTMGMMSGSMMAGMMGPGIFSSYPGEPISLDQAEQAAQAYLSSLADDNLVLDEIMIFENHAYAQIVEESTGIGAMEILIDPTTLSVYPEFGPNMMWNTKYGMMGGSYGMMGMGPMMGHNFGQANYDDMRVTAEEAVEIAQDYLDNSSLNLEADEHADSFYGYYTLHVLDGDEIVGMLSVNGYSGEVFPHSWHEDIVEMSDKHE